jgi:D-tyrosyl-tRNA(Tyr) deacylase
MISVVQRVLAASVTVESQSYVAQIGPGLCVLLGVEQGDAEGDAQWMAGKLARLRIFRDDQGKMNRSVQDLSGEALVISQFTLAGDCSKGNRPSFVNAAPPDVGQNLYERVCHLLEREHRVPVKTGIFGAMMKVQLINDGPVTLIIRSRSGSPVPPNRPEFLADDRRL